MLVPGAEARNTRIYAGLVYFVLYRAYSPANFTVSFDSFNLYSTLRILMSYSDSWKFVLEFSEFSRIVIKQKSRARTQVQWT